jgi:hypothetical protein
MFSNIRTATAVVTVTFMNTRGYGFCRIDGTVDVRVKVDQLVEAGFGPADFKEGSTVMIERDEQRDGKVRAKRIVAVGDCLAPKFFKTSVADRHNGFVIEKVTEAGRERFPTYRIIDAEGKFVSNELFLGEARNKIGKTINPPVSLNAGKKTNVGGLGHVKGDSNGKGQQQSGGKKKAA